MPLKCRSLSMSSVRSYLKCGAKYKYSKIDSFPPEFESAQALFGKAIHNAAQCRFLALKEGREFNVDAMERVFTSVFNAVPDSKIKYSKTCNRESLIAKARPMCQLLFDWKPPGRIVQVESSYFFPIGFNIELDFVGRSDLEVRDEQGKLWIIEIKTSSKSYSDGDYADAVEQLTAYAKDHFAKEKREIMGKVLVMKKSKTPTLEERDFELKEDNFENLAIKFAGVKKGIEAEVFIKNQSFLCAACPYQKRCKGEDEVNTTHEEEPVTLTCCVCGKERYNSLLIHIQSAHSIHEYLELFPGVPIVAPKIYRDIHDEFVFGFKRPKEKNETGIELTEEEKQLVFATHEDRRVRNSEIIITA